MSFEVSMSLATLCDKCRENPPYEYGYCINCLDGFITKQEAATLLGCSLFKLHRLTSSYPELLRLYSLDTKLRLDRAQVLKFIDAVPIDVADDTKWSKRFLKCRLCKTTDNKHYGGGYCTDCYQNTKEFTVINAYMNGENLAEIGEAIGVTRERARQLFERALKIEVERKDSEVSLTNNELREHLKSMHKQNRAAREYKSTIEEKYETILKQLAKPHVLGERGLLDILGMPRSVLPLIEQQYPEFLEIISQNKSRWSWKYDQCRMCGTTEVKHKRWGYCEKCYTRSDEWKEQQYQYRQNHLEEHRARTRAYGAVYSRRPEVRERLKQRTHDKNFDGNRENAFLVHGAKCYDCGISRTEFQANNLKDLAVYHADGNSDNNVISNLHPLCFSCLAKRVKG